MPAIRRFEDIEAWKKARELVREIYKICSEGRLSKDFGLRDQLCRAAVSSMSNIAEGFSRNSDKDFSHFLDIAKGSVLEVQSLLYVTLDIGYIEQGDFERLSHLANAAASLISGFTLYLRKQARHSTLDTGH
jgi:four helix bundle protein